MDFDFPPGRPKLGVTKSAHPEARLTEYVPTSSMKRVRHLHADTWRERLHVIEV